MNETLKIQLFAKQVLAKLRGDNTEATAQKIARKSLFAIESQISGLKAALNDKRDCLNDKQEAFEDAIYPQTPFEHGKDYVQAISYAKENVDRVKQEVADLEEQLAFWEKLLEERFKE